jgi:hypothetical protein
MSGDVHHSLEGWSNAARVSGITNLQWQIIEEETTESKGTQPISAD